jgi:hypothetical protein
MEAMDLRNNMNYNNQRYMTNPKEYGQVAVKEGIAPVGPLAETIHSFPDA